MEESYHGRRVTVMGLGTFGAGIAATRFFARTGAAVTVTDLRTQAQLADSLEQLRGIESLTLRLGGHDEQDFRDADLVVVSPSVKPRNRYVELAAAHGAAITSEMRLFWPRCRAPIVGVTGSNGKSTTATLIHDILAADGQRVWLGGNIGCSLLTCVDEIGASDWVVLELSSFQLDDLDRDRHSPHVGVVTNLSPNHLDWHGSMESYAAAKQTLYRWQDSDDIAVRLRGGMVADWPTAGQNVWCAEAGEGGAEVTWQPSDRTIHFVGTEERVALDACPGLAAPHLRSASLLAAATGFAVGARIASIDRALRAFTGLPHRLQWIETGRGRWVVNDSSSTTPESTIAALKSTSKSLTLITGGAEKGSDLDELAEAIVRLAARVIVIGDVREKLVDAVNRHVDAGGKEAQGGPSMQRLRRECVWTADSLAAAVATTIRQTPLEDVVLFSPGFASGSMFRNFDDRGRAFVELVREATA